MGTHSSTLNSVAQAILRFCEDNQIRLVPQFVPGHLNVLADSLSRRSQVLGSEWTFYHQAFREFLRLWPATIDLFATSFSARLPVYFSPVADPQSVGTDVMMQPWDGLQAYAFPPFGLLYLVLSKVRQSRGLKLTFVAPFWPQCPGFRTFWSFWWWSQCSFLNRGIYSDSPTPIAFTRTSMRFV